MIDIKYTCAEEIRQMNIFKWIESEKCGSDIGEQACFEWVQKYAKTFREFTKTLPEQCINCGLNCPKNSNECVNPFNENRVKFFQSLH